MNINSRQFNRWQLFRALKIVWNCKSSLNKVNMYDFLLLFFFDKCGVHENDMLWVYIAVLLFVDRIYLILPLCRNCLFFQRNATVCRMYVREPPQLSTMGNESSLYAYKYNQIEVVHIVTLYLCLFLHEAKTHRAMRARYYTKPWTGLRYPNENFCLLILFTCAVKIHSRAPNAYIRSAKWG